MIAIRTWGVVLLLGLYTVGQWVFAADPPKAPDAAAPLGKRDVFKKDLAGNEEVEKIMGENFLRVFTAIRGG